MGNLLLMNLLMGELLVAFYGIPLDFLSAARGGWEWGKQVCQATGFLLTMLGMASINNLTAISVFRLLVVSYEGHFARHSRKVAIILIILSWLWSFLMALPPIVGWGAYSIEDNGMSCAPTWKDPEDFQYNIYLFTC